MNKYIPYYWADMSFIMAIAIFIVAMLSLMIFDQEVVLVLIGITLILFVNAIVLRLKIKKKLKTIYSNSYNT